MALPCDLEPDTVTIAASPHGAVCRYTKSRLRQGPSDQCVSPPAVQLVLVSIHATWRPIKGRQERRGDLLMSDGVQISRR